MRSAGGEGEGEQKPLQGLTAVVLGTGGAARALAFGAAERGANVVVAGRLIQRACELAFQLSDTSDQGISACACEISAVQNGSLESMDVVLNTTPIGMVGKREGETPVPAEVLQKVCCAAHVRMHGAHACAPLPPAEDAS